MGFLPEMVQNYVSFKDRPMKYEALNNSEESYTPPSGATTTAAKSRIKVSFFLAGLVAALFIFLGSASVISILTPTPKTHAEIEAEEWNYCGRSSKVAMERGCVMEPLFYGWMPPQCSWKEFSDRWPVFEDRTYYEDTNLTMPIPKEDLWAGKHIMIYTRKYVKLLPSWRS